MNPDEETITVFSTFPRVADIELPLGASFGPFVAGPEGVHLYEVMMGDPRSWTDDTSAYEAVLAERAVTPLPDPPIELPDWLVDTRGETSP